jgi:hypothetical protein
MQYFCMWSALSTDWQNLLPLTPDGIGDDASAGPGALVAADDRRWPNWQGPETAHAENVNETYVSRTLRLTLLAPEMVEAILNGGQSEGMTLPGLKVPFLGGVGESAHGVGHTDFLPSQADRLSRPTVDWDTS